MQNRTAEDRLVILDLVRGLAALLVVLGHARAMLVVDFQSIETKNYPFDLLFYFSTGLGHQAVLVFFALSGYLVGGRAFDKILRRQWDPVEYIVSRTVRLWAVLIPALLVTFVFDFQGMSAFGSGLYAGEFHNQLGSGPQPEAPIQLDSTVFLGNVLFLQTLAVPTYGSNGALWSLSNEFWYYLVFPFALSALNSKRSLFRALGLLLCISAAVTLPQQMMLLGIVWVAGALSYLISKVAWFEIYSQSPFYKILTTILFSMLIIVSFLQRSLILDISLGVAFAALLPVLTPLKVSLQPLRRISIWSSEASFSLYATHLPLLFLLYSTIAPSEQIEPSLVALGWILLFCVIAVIFSACSPSATVRQIGKIA